MKRGQESTIADNSSTNLTRIALRERELLRQRYRPNQVRILFIGEAPPVSGRFFYQADSGLYRAFRETFVAAFPSLQPPEFLAEFRALGCYLVDRFRCSRFSESTEPKYMEMLSGTRKVRSFRAT
jgi:hypothetical protein